MQQKTLVYDQNGKLFGKKMVVFDNVKQMRVLFNPLAWRDDGVAITQVNVSCTAVSKDLRFYEQSVYLLYSQYKSGLPSATLVSEMRNSASSLDYRHTARPTRAAGSHGSLCSPNILLAVKLFRWQWPRCQPRWRYRSDAFWPPLPAWGPAEPFGAVTRAQLHPS